MAKTAVSSGVPLFGTCVPYETKEARKTVIVSVSRDSDGHSVIEHQVIEDQMKNHIALDYREALLSTLVAKGIDPHGLDMIEVSKLGIDRSVDDLANYIIANSHKFVLPKNSEE